MKQQMEIRIVYKPRPDAERERALALDALAEAFADLYIARARAEVARELGVAEETIDRARGRLTDDLHTLRALPAGFDSDCEDRVTPQADDSTVCRRPRRVAGRKG